MRRPALPVHHRAEHVEGSTVTAVDASVESLSPARSAAMRVRGEPSAVREQSEGGTGTATSGRTPASVIERRLGYQADRDRLRALGSGGMITDPYKALGVRAGASAAAIREAYRVRRDRGSAAQQRAAAEAYAILGDPRLRSEYDRGHVVGVGAGRYVEPSTSRRVRRRRESSLPSGRCPTAPKVRPAFGALMVASFVLAAISAVSDNYGRGFGVRQPPSVAARAATDPVSVVSPSRPRHVSAATALGRLTSGTCLAAGPGHDSVLAGSPITCDQPHVAEVSLRINLNRLVGGAPASSEPSAVAGQCQDAFVSYTGLAQPTAGLSYAWLTTIASAPDTSWTVCIVTSAVSRTTSAHHIVG